MGRTQGATRRTLAALALLGLAAAAEAQDLVIGQIAPVGVATTPEARWLHEGTRACVDQVNRQGGVKGRRLQLFVVDDGLQPARVAEKFQEAMARQPIALVNLMGSALLGGILSSRALDQHEVVIVGAIPGAEAFRRPGHERLFHVRSGDRVQLARILRHGQTLGLQRIHVVAQDVGVGQSGLAMLRADAPPLGITITSSVSTLEPGSIAEAVRLAVAAQAQAHVVIGFPHYMADVLHRLREAGVAQAVFGLGYLSPPLAVQAAGLPGARGLGLTQALPNPNGRVLPLQRDFQAAMRQAYPALTEYSSFHVEGCIGVRVLVEGLRRLEGPPTPAALARTLRGMAEVDFGGFRVHFNGGQEGSGWSDIGVISATGKLVF